MTKRSTGKIDKGWGFEVVWANTETYCGKILCFNDTGSKMSMHFHKEKDETWFVNNGTFILRWIDTKDASLHEKVLKEGDVWHNPPLQPHQLECLVPGGMIFEVSTADSTEDNFRVSPGDSQIKV